MKLRKKLTSRRGESLTETLVGILIVGLSSVVLASMVTAASNINTTAIGKDEALYAAVASAEDGTAPVSGESTVDVNVTVGAVVHEFSAALCGDGSVPLYSYRYDKGGTP